MELAHKPGSLATILNILGENEINLTKIQSVPIIGKPYQYAFHIDLSWKERFLFDSALRAISGEGSTLKILGLYKSGIFEAK